MTSEINEESRLNAKRVYMNINTVYFAGYNIFPRGISRLDMRFKDEKGEIIGSCHLTDKSSGKVECHNLKTGESYNLPEDFLTEMTNISKELFTTIYDEWLKSVERIPGIDLVKIRFTPKTICITTLCVYRSYSPTG